MNSHLIALFDRAPALKPLLPEINAAFELLLNSLLSGHKLLLCGNGGSAADADHWSGELLKGFKKKRPLLAREREHLPPDIASRLQRGIPAIPLTVFPALGTAFSNDVDGSLTFAQLVNALGNKGDVLIALSTSGNAANVNAAAIVAKTKGLFVLGMTGSSGGQLLGRCDICLRMPSDETYRIQEFHLPVYHCLSLMLEDAMFPD